jgi:Ca-activated chloride channel family protein
MRHMVILAVTSLAGLTVARNVIAQYRDEGPAVKIVPRSGARGAAGTDAASSANIRVDTTLVPIPVAVTDPLSRFVTGLEKEDFRLYEDKVEQQIAHFSTQDAPISVGIVFDTSGSMGPKLSWSGQAVTQFLRTANPEDEFFLIEFNDSPSLSVALTSNGDEIRNRLIFTQAKGATALLDAIYLAMSQLKKARNSWKAVLIISDGGDNASRYTEREVKNAVLESDSQLYAIGILEPLEARGRTPEEANGPELLRGLAEQTGGRAYAAVNPTELPDIAAKIGIEFQNEYVLYYSPKNFAHDGKYHRVQVKLAKRAGLPALRTAFRTGYFAPAQ